MLSFGPLHCNQRSVLVVVNGDIFALELSCLNLINVLQVCVLAGSIKNDVEVIILQFGNDAVVFDSTCCKHEHA